MDVAHTNTLRRSRDVASGTVVASGLRFCGIASLIATLLFTASCSTPVPQSATNLEQPGRDPDRLLMVDCLLPGQLRRLGRNISFVTPRRPTKVNASECEIRGGEYVAYDRANFATSLRIWLPKAETGDAEAQTFVGEIFEKGLGQTADAAVAAQWYRRAAEQGYSRAMINLGYLYESGLGVEQNMTTAMNYYRKAAGFDEGNLEYVTSVEVAARKQQDAQFPVLLQQVQDANARLKTEKQAFAELQSGYANLQKQAEEARQKLMAADSRSAAAGHDPDQAKVGELLAEMNSLEDHLNASDEERTHLLQLLEEQQSQTSKLRKKVSSASNKLLQAEDDLASQTAQINQLESELSNQRSSSTAESQQQIETLEQQLKQYTASRDDLLQQIDSIKSSQSAEAQELKVQLQVAEARESSLKNDLDGSLTKVEELQRTLESRDADYRRQLEVLNRSRSGMHTRLTAQQETIRSLETKIEEIQKASSDSESADMSAARESVGKLQKQLTQARVELEEIQKNKQDTEQDSLAQLATLENALQAQREVVRSQQQKIGSLQQEVSQIQAKETGPAIEQLSRSVPSGPSIEIIDPPVTMRDDRFTIPVGASNDQIDVIGRVSPAVDLISFRVNGGAQSVNEHGVFHHHATLGADSQNLQLAAVDNAGQRTAIELTLLKTGNSAVPPGVEDMIRAIDVSQVDFGRYHALVIGNSNYQSMPAVETAVRDATAVSRILENRFGFNTELLLNADQYDILAALNRKRDELSRTDNLIIYYAGHGESGGGQGYWLPTDADPAEKSGWISNVALTGLIDSMTAKHVMIVADSVFSGTLSRSSLIRLGSSMDANERLRLYELASHSKVRTVLTSGSDQPVSDGTGSDSHSVFATSLLQALSTKKSGVVMAQDIFIQIRDMVELMRSTASTGLHPQYAPIQYAGHENGEFMFVPLDRQTGKLE